MHYFTKEIAPDEVLTATCEDGGLVATLEARGYTECLHAAWSAARAEQDRLTRLAGDIHPPSFVADQDEPVAEAPTMGPVVQLPKVYASSWKH
jgi:hypothetical protein